MESEGTIVNDPEPMPVDPYSKRRENPFPVYKTPSECDRAYQFRTMDRKVKERPSVPNAAGNHYKPNLDVMQPDEWNDLQCE